MPLFTMRERHHYAGFWIRAAARVIDLILLLAAFQLFLLVDRKGADAGFWAPSGFGDGNGFDRFPLENAARGIFFLCFRVLNEDGSPLNYRRALLRWLGYFLCDLTLNFGYLWAAFDPRKQGLHDKVCRTIVVHENAGAGA
jgi:uncharacterized RDD family membrane protein YckC